MKLTSIVAASTVLASMSAHALIGPVGPNTVTPLADDFLIFANVVAGQGTAFADVFGFTLSQRSDVTAAVADYAVPGLPSTVAGTSLAGLVVLDLNAQPVLFDVTPADGLVLTGQLTAGTYALAVFGATTGSEGGIYIGTVGAVTAVPDLDTYQMLLLGLVALNGWAARHRRG